MEKIKEQRLKIESEIDKLEEMGGKWRGQAKNLRDSTFTRFPVIVVFLSTFGLVATLYGFEKTIDEIGFFRENPKMVLVAGVLVLVLTGTLYKKLN